MAKACDASGAGSGETTGRPGTVPNVRVARGPSNARAGSCLQAGVERSAGLFRQIQSFTSAQKGDRAIGETIVGEVTGVVASLFDLRRAKLSLTTALPLGPVERFLRLSHERLNWVHSNRDLARYGAS